MLLNKANIDLANICGKETMAYAFDTVGINKNGVVATDGKMVIVAGAQNEGKDHFKPSKNEFSDKWMLIDKDDFKDIKKIMPKKSDKLQQVVKAEPIGDDAVRFSGFQEEPDAKVPCKTISMHTVDGRLPDFDKYIPSTDGRKAFRISVKALEKLTKVAKAFNDTKDIGWVDMFFDPEDFSGPMLVRSENIDRGQRMHGAIMPIKRPEDTEAKKAQEAIEEPAEVGSE